MNNLYYEDFLPKDKFFTLDEIIQEYGSAYKINFENSLVLKDEKLFEAYKTQDLIAITVQNDTNEISKRLLHDLLTQEGLYKYLQTNLDNSLGIAIRLDFIYDANSFTSIKITRAELLEALNIITDELSQKEKMRSAIIKSTLSLYSCEQKYSNFTHKCFIDGNVISIDARILLEILTMPENKFDLFVKGELSYGYSKEYLAFAIVDFIQRERILTKYVLPDNVYNRYKKLEDYSLIDYESLNKNRIRNDETEDGLSIVDKITLDEYLEKELNKYKKKEYSPLEEAIYYYLRLCELLTYDQEYFVIKGNHDIHAKHEYIDNINAMNLDNNGVITYDFILLYARILKNLGIQYTIDQTLLAGIDQGNAKLTFKYGEYLVAISSIDNIESSDLTNVKINDDIVNIKSINQNTVTKAKFDELVYRIYDEIIKRKEDTKRFQESLKNYKNKYASQNLSIKEKMYVLLKRLARSDLKGIDMVAYEKKVFDNIFGNNPSIKMNFICSQINAHKEYNLTPLMIISIINDGDYTYYVIDPNNADVVDIISKEELIDMFESKYYFYITNQENIPGIDKAIGEVYVK